MQRFLTAKQYIIFLLLSYIVLACTRVEEFPIGTMLHCDAEILNKKGDKFIAANDSSVFFDGGKKQTKNESFSGNHSVFTLPGNKAFAFGYTIKKAGPDWYFRISVWRKSKDGKGAIVAAGKNAKELYLATSKPIEIDDKGWERLELDVYTPPGFFRDKLVFYAWNNGSDTVYFDDFKIERLAKKQYPSFEEEPLNIYFDTTDYLKIYEKRKQAFNYGVLQTSDNDWVKAIVFGDDKMMKARIRLKGDWLDHLRGDKWSYRIKMRKNYSWNRLRTFSVQTPASREFILEWIAHQFFTEADVLTTRYGFIPLSVNDESKGLYAWEEHFEKQLLENRNRREGPIVKFTEDAFWQVQKMGKQSGDWPVLPYYEASVAKPFKVGRTTSDLVLYNQFLNAQKLMYQYKHHLKPPEDIFDLEKLASYYAMLDITQTRHGMVWHNQRMYFNPVLCKLEPITFDCYSSDVSYSFDLKSNLAYMSLSAIREINPESYLLYDLFKNRKFVDRYIIYLEEYSNEEFIAQNMEKMLAQINKYDSLIKMEFPYYHFDPDFYYKSAQGIRNYLPELKKFIATKLADTTHHFKIKKNKFTAEQIYEDTPRFFVHAYTQSVAGDSVTVKIENFFPGKLVILGTGRKNKYVDFYQHPEPEIEAYDGSANRELIISSDTSSKNLFFILDGQIETYSIPIYPWPSPEGITSQQELIANVNLHDSNLIERINGIDIYIKSDDIGIDYPVIFPKGYKIHFGPGTRLDFVENSMFISYSPIVMKGTSTDPIIVTSSDFTANGFTVLQADGKSVIDHVVFENLNTLDYKGWTLTGAVTFYESDVEITNTKFYRNQCEDALNTIRSEFIVKKTSFDHIYGDAFDSDFCTGLVDLSSFSNVGNDAIDFSGSQITIRDTKIENTNDKGISGGEDSKLLVERTTIHQANIGIASKDLSLVQINNSSIIDCNYGLVLLQKKPEYGPATIELNNTELINSKTDMLIEKGSKVNNEGLIIKGKEKKLADIFYK